MTFDVYEQAKGASKIGITGHIRPDGDCIGSVLALSLYLKKRMPEASVEVFLEQPAASFRTVPHIRDIITDFPEREAFDVFFVVDTDPGRIGGSARYFESAKKTVNIDHHISNAKGGGMVNHVIPQASAAAEIVYELIETEYMDAEIAQLLYLGISHDTGVFHFSNTSPRTMRIAADLIEYGFDFPKFLDDTFFGKTYLQNKLLAQIVLDSRLFYDGKVILGTIRGSELEAFGATTDDVEGAVNRLQVTEGVECAVFIYEKKQGLYKCSFRASSDLVDVSKVGAVYGGGGHKRASGCESTDPLEVTVEKLMEAIGEQLKKEDFAS